jgi:hypothetical protein
MLWPDLSLNSDPPPGAQSFLPISSIQSPNPALQPQRIRLASLDLLWGDLWLPSAPIYVIPFGA